MVLIDSQSVEPDQQQAAVARFYDVIALNYDSAYQSPFYQAENAVVFSLLKKLLAPDAVVLDLGCGTGLLLEGCCLSAQQYVGLDLSAAMLAQAQAKFPAHTFLQGDMRDLSFFPPGAFDVIVSLFGGLSHVAAQATVLQECYRVLAPGGILFLMNHGPAYEKHQSYVLDQIKAERIPFFFEAARQMRAMTAMAGFQHIRVQGMSTTIEKFPVASPRLLQKLLSLEMQTVGRLFPDSGYHQMVFAQKPGELAGDRL